MAWLKMDTVRSHEQEKQARSEKKTDQVNNKANKDERGDSASCSGGLRPGGGGSAAAAVAAVFCIGLPALLA